MRRVKQAEVKISCPTKQPVAVQRITLSHVFHQGQKAIVGYCKIPEMQNGIPHPQVKEGPGCVCRWKGFFYLENKGPVEVNGKAVVLQCDFDFVPFVLWTNFVLGFAYIVAGIGLFLGKSWAKPLSMGIAGITLVTYAAFGIHVAMGGLFKAETVKVMAIRTLLWISIAFIANKADNIIPESNQVGSK